MLQSRDRAVLGKAALMARGLLAGVEHGRGDPLLGDADLDPTRQWTISLQAGVFF